MKISQILQISEGFNFLKGFSVKKLTNDTIQLVLNHSRYDIRLINKSNQWQLHRVDKNTQESEKPINLNIEDRQTAIKEIATAIVCLS